MTVRECGKATLTIDGKVIQDLGDATVRSERAAPNLEFTAFSDHRGEMNITLTSSSEYHHYRRTWKKLWEMARRKYRPDKRQRRKDRRILKRLREQFKKTVFEALISAPRTREAQIQAIKEAVARQLRISPDDCVIESGHGRVVGIGVVEVGVSLGPWTFETREEEDREVTEGT